jgi:hypothetical protein
LEKFEEAAMKVNCLVCGHSIDIGSAYDDYSGQIRCFVCHSLMEIKTEEGNLKSVKLPPVVPPGSGQPAGAAERSMP